MTTQSNSSTAHYNLVLHSNAQQAALNGHREKIAGDETENLRRR